MMDTIKHTYLSTTQIFRILYQWYTLWQELRQLQPMGQRHTHWDTNYQLPQTLPPQDECITEIWQQCISTPFEDHITVSQDLSQDPQVNTVELSFNLHFPNVTQERINTPLVVHNNRTLKEFIQGEERCLKFINQDLTFLQELHIPSTFTNVSHTTTSLKEPRQLILVNTARALKFLESYASQQIKLWKVLLKYHNLPDHFHHLKPTLQTEFELLKTATSKNIQNLQETVQSQQAYTTVLSGHITALHTKLAHLGKQIQIHCIHPHSQSDAVQLNAPDYDPDIDGEPDSINAVQPSNADSVKEDTFTGTSKPEDHTTICPTTNRSEHQPPEVPSDIQINEHDIAEQQ